MTQLQDVRFFEPTTLQRQAIAPHRGDVTTMQAFNRLEAEAAARGELFLGRVARTAPAIPMSGDAVRQRLFT